MNIEATVAAMVEGAVDDADREILGGSDLIAETRTLIKRVAQTQVTVLIQGESAVSQSNARCVMPFKTGGLLGVHLCS